MQDQSSDDRNVKLMRAVRRALSDAHSTLVVMVRHMEQDGYNVEMLSQAMVSTADAMGCIAQQITNIQTGGTE